MRSRLVPWMVCALLGLPIVGTAEARFASHLPDLAERDRLVAELVADAITDDAPPPASTL